MRYSLWHGYEGKDMDFFQLTIISLIQGITEFLPISSSGHLVLLPAVTSFQDQGQLIDVAAHFGTLGAVIIYLWSDIFKMARATLTFGRSDKQGLLMSMMLILQACLSYLLVLS